MLDAHALLRIAVAGPLASLALHLGFGVPAAALSGMRVRDFMVSDPVAVRAHLLVFEGGRFHGLLTHAGVARLLQMKTSLAVRS